MSDIDDLVRIQTDQSITYNNIPGFVAKFLVSRGKRLKIVYANDQFREFFGSDGILDDANEMFRLNMEKNAEVLENLWEDIRQTKPLHFLTQLQNRRGQTLWMQVSGECVETLADGCVYLLIYIDVTDVTGLKEIQKKLEAALDAAEKANRAKTIFLSHMSHDIRTPINGVLGMTDIALRNIDDRERLVDCLKKIDSSSHHLLSLINDVLDMSRIESGKVVIEDKPFYVSVLLDGCYSVVAGQAIQKISESKRISARSRRMCWRATRYALDKFSSIFWATPSNSRRKAGRFSFPPQPFRKMSAKHRSPCACAIRASG